MATGLRLLQMGPGGRPRDEKATRYAEAMKNPMPASIQLLFARHPALSGFSVRGLADVPDNCARSGDESELFVADIGVSPSLAPDEFGELFEEIAATLAELLVEQPGADDLLRGRTFARTLH